MKNEKREYLGILCNLYIVILLAVLPLYIVGGYYKLGDMKYLFFRNSSFICLGIWLVLEACSLLYNLYDKVRAVGLSAKVKVHKSAMGLETVDIFVLAYGICVLLSAVHSRYESAWIGYSEWYMGAVSQLIFVGIYFFVSRYYSYDRLPLYVGEAAFLAVVVIGLLNRLELDPLGIFRIFTEKDWEYSHLLSTIGNINWFCGYCSVMLALPLSGYLHSRRKNKTRILYVICMLGLTLLFIQGSDSGPVLVAVVLGCCLLTGMKKPEFFQKTLLLFIGMAVNIWIMGRLITIFGAQQATPIDGGIYEKMLWNGWLVLACLAGIFYLFCRSLLIRSQEKTARQLIKIFLSVLFMTMGTIMCFVMLKWSQGATDAWGSGRGELWRLAWEGFLQTDAVEKLIGVGPDCYAEYLISIGRTPIITDEGRWANAIFANAHNEWLNHLVNIGIIGTVCYAGIFIGAIKRYRGMLLSVLILAMYGVHSLVSFQQVLNAPLFFVMLGLCEAAWRRKMTVNDLTGK